MEFLKNINRSQIIVQILINYLIAGVISEADIDNHLEALVCFPNMELLSQLSLSHIIKEKVLALEYVPISQ